MGDTRNPSRDRLEEASEILSDAEALCTVMVVQEHADMILSTEVVCGCIDGIERLIRKAREEVEAATDAMFAEAKVG